MWNHTLTSLHFQLVIRDEMRAPCSFCSLSLKCLFRSGPVLFAMGSVTKETDCTFIYNTQNTRSIGRRNWRGLSSASHALRWKWRGWPTFIWFRRLSTEKTSMPFEKTKTSTYNHWILFHAIQINITFDRIHLRFGHQLESDDDTKAHPVKSSSVKLCKQTEPP